METNPTPSIWTATARKRKTSDSATASTVAWARPWRGWKSAIALDRMLDFILRARRFSRRVVLGPHGGRATAAGPRGVAVDLPGHGDRVDEESTLSNRRDAIVCAVQPGNAPSATPAEDSTPRSPRTPSPNSSATSSTWPPRCRGKGAPTRRRWRCATPGGKFEADVGEMLGYLKFDDDGAMRFADFDGAWKYFYHDCDEATARWAFDRLGPERFGDTTVTPVSVPAFWAADLPRSFIRCLQDHSMPRWLADTVTRRLGVRAVDDRHVALTVPQSTARTGRVAGTRHDHQADRPVGARLIPASRRETAPKTAGNRHFCVCSLESYPRPVRMTPLQSAAACRNLAAS